MLIYLLFMRKKKLEPFPQTATGPSGSPGKLVVLDSRTELDCLIEFINDEFDDPKALRYLLNLVNFLLEGFGNVVLHPKLLKLI